MRRIIFPAAFAAMLTAFPAAAELEAFTLDPSHTFPLYEIGHFDYSFQRGRFNKTSGRINLDLAAKSGSADIAIDTASVSSGIEKLDEHLRSKDFFNSEQYPQMTFKANRFEFDGDKLRSASGELTISGVARPVTLTASHFNCAPHPSTKKKVCGADLTTRIKRSDYGMKYGLPVLADDVLLRINVEAIKD